MGEQRRDISKKRIKRTEERKKEGHDENKTNGKMSRDVKERPGRH